MTLNDGQMRRWQVSDRDTGGSRHNRQPTRWLALVGLVAVLIACDPGIITEASDALRTGWA